jgi:hypothetical protein
MIAHEMGAANEPKPSSRNRGQHLSLAGNGRWHHDIECRDAIGRHEQHARRAPIGRQRVEIANFARAAFRQSKVRLEERVTRASLHAPAV